MNKNTKMAIVAGLIVLVWLSIEMFLDLTGVWRLPALLK